MLDAVGPSPDASGDESPTLLLERALRMEQDGGVAVARDLMRQLRQRLPRWDEVALRLADSLRRSGEAEAAIFAYEDVLEINSGRPEALLALGTLLLTRGEIARAQNLFLRCCGVAADCAEAWDALGTTLLLTGDHRAATSSYAAAQRLAPGVIDIALHLAEAAWQAGTAAAELESLQFALQHDETNPALLAATGLLLERLGRRAEAIDSLILATALEPDHAATQGLLALNLVRANRVGEAITALDRAIALAPEDLSLRNNRAATLLRLHRYREARDELESLVAQYGEHGGLLNNLSNALVSLGEQDAGVRMAERAVALEPQSGLAWRTLCNALPYAEGIGGRELLAALRGASTVLPRSSPAIWPNPLDPNRRLRIGLLSSSLKTHPVGWLTIAGFENLDPNAFELYCIGPEHGADTVFRRFRAIAAAWITPDGLAPDALLEAVRALGLDILIDLGGYGDLGMMPLCAHRLAPIQMKWVGSQNHSTGLAEMDWFITDRWETPASLAGLYSERLQTLPDGYVCYSPPPYAPDVAALPALASGQVTFGCFNNLAKVTRGTVVAWARILCAVPASRLLVKCHQMVDPITRARLLADFATQGVTADRIVTRAGSPHRDLLGQYSDVDIVLDPFPYTGGLTTCEALWMGVPVVTLAGEIFAARHSASHLSNIGLADWVAGDLDRYHHIATTRARDLASLAVLRQGLRARMKASPLCDGRRFGRNLGSALRAAWQDWCAAA